MKLSTIDVAHILIALATLMAAAHLVGSLFASIRQPKVIGEIVGGLLLGPTVLGALAPDVAAWLFPETGATPVILGAVYQLGLLLLLFCAGAEIRSAFSRSEAKPVAWITMTGMVLPFVAGLGFLRLIDQQDFWGPNATSASFTLVFATAIAVTSIPVITRIMYDLGILDTAFARIVLSVAVIEDVALYVVLAIALGIAAGGGSTSFGLPAALGLEPGTPADIAYHVAVTVAVLWVFLVPVRLLYSRAVASRFNVLHRRSPVGHQLLFMLACTVGCLALGVEAFFGAFLAGVAVGASQETGESLAAIRGFSFAFFIPIYFALVGLQLDLLNGFSVWFFLGFLVFACAAKAASVYLGARLGGETSGAAVNLAVAMNARGGPGIVLASVAFAAGVVNQSFYATLVMLAIVTSLLAGSWLERVPRDRLRERPEPKRRGTATASSAP
jgi:Kef-type K+ transport system membrane component KefB